MEVTVARFRAGDIDAVYAIQRAAFRPLYEKYRDDATSPYLESRETVLRKYARPGTSGYVLRADGAPVGAVRVAVRPGEKLGRISALCVLPEWQSRGVAQRALREIERLHGDIEAWSLDTILEEAGNCHLYEKLGYVRVGEAERIQENMTLVRYEKRREGSRHPGEEPMEMSV